MSDNEGMSEPQNYDHVSGGPIRGQHFPITGSMKITGPLAESVVFQQPPPAKLCLFVNDEGLVDAKYDNLTEAALALIEEVRRVQVSLKL